MGHCATTPRTKRVRTRRQTLTTPIPSLTHLLPTSQLLDILLDINYDSSLPTTRHFDLSSPPPTPSLDPDTASTTAPSLTNLERNTTYTPHNLPSPSILPTDLASIAYPSFLLSPPSAAATSAPGYMTAAHEREYLHALDTALAASGNDPAALANAARLRDTRRTSIDADRFALLHPASTYNWLKAHREGEDASGGEGAGLRRRRGKEVDEDEEGEGDSSVEPGGAKRGKRRDSDGAHRGRGLLSGKRKRDERNGNGAANGRVKKLRVGVGEGDTGDEA